MVFKNLLFIFLFLMLASCVPQSGGGGKSLRQSSNVGTTPTATPAGGAFVNTSQLFWATPSYTGQVITMNSNTLSSFYLRGKDVETYLSSSTTAFNSIYCLEYTFSSPALTLRSRLVPITINNLSTGLVEKLFRVDIENETQSQFACKDLVVNPNVVFYPTNVCPTCQTTQTTSSVKLYKSNGTSIGSQVATSGNASLSLTALSFRLDPINNSNSNAGSCSDNQCRNQGYDCCLSGQCIKDGSVKPSALSDANYLNIVSQLVNNQFSSYTSWPQYYYVCPKLPDPIPTPTPTATPDPSVVALANLNNLKNDYYCVRELMATAPYSPFNTYDFSTTTFPASLCTGTQTQIDTCLQTYRQNFATAGDMCNATSTLNYLNVMKRLYSICGCSMTDWTLALTNPAHPVNACPNFYLKALDINNIETTTDSNIVNVICAFPDPNPVATPFQNLNVNLPARTAPHRFFKSTDGSAVDNIAVSTAAGITAEGTEFKYLDPGTYIMPQNSSFNMNSILGQFNVNLSMAFPAKVVDLEYDATYVISTLSGYYSPCPTCMRDSWFSAFTAYPNSNTGTGLQAHSYSTDRETSSLNIYSGNYEDTHFGRACFIPPTMIPYSHKSYTSIPTQRQSRLATQAAYYMNGYQRDWFGFNRGAVIGSFDGVTWFAIGKGRRVKATSSKLFLAINAPFADLAAPSSMVVSVRQDEGIATAAEYDYDTTLSPNDYKQNEAGTCQRFHMCDDDSDCVGKLGWEYVCADVASLKTYWPKFNSKAEETGTQTLLLSQVLQSGQLPGSSTKRCVYRGAGAPCNTDYYNLTNANTRKLQSCAPNFYCADRGSGNFNSEIARFATALENIPLALNHLYGQDANVIGRPLHYYSASSSLTTTIKDAINSNALLMSNSYGGICRPGRDVSSNDMTNTQKTKDGSGRVDYINQIAGCSSANLSTGATPNTAGSKIYACPIIDENTGNYVQFVANSTSQGASTGAVALSITQNTCGKEAQSSTGNSPFVSIEGKALSTTTVVNKTLVENACLRRAGAVCHTDLDCSPNHMHSDVAGNYSINTYFGGTLAEQKYWQEYLVCGQATRAPAYDPNNSQKYFDYDMGKNRCCREIGKDMTLYTAGDPLNESLSSSLNPSTVSFSSPSTAGRYSRYTVLQGYPSSTYPAPNVATILSSAKQWKTIGETAQKTCCGGGWIRKFADGTHNWPIGSRSNFDITNFKCLNYTLSSAVEKPADVPSVNYSTDIDLYCIGTTASYNCAQVDYAATSGNQIVSPSLYGWFTSAAYELVNLPTYNWGFTEIAKLWTNNAEFGYTVGVNRAPKEHMLFVPVFKSYAEAGVGTAAPTTWQQSYFPASDTRVDQLTFYVPSFIYDNSPGGSPRGIGQIYLFSPSGFGCAVDVNYASDSTKDCTTSDASGAWYQSGYSSIWLTRIRCEYNGAANPYGCQWSYNATDGTITIARDWDWVALGNGVIYVQIEYDTYNQRRGGLPGNDLYYLNKLGKMELNGIPQVLQEPLYCSSDRDKLVPGLFQGTTRSWVQANDINDTSNVIVNNTSNPDTLNATDKSLLYSSKLNNAQIFSNNEMTCCLKLGQDSPSNSQCCSSLAKNGVCVLPKKTDLNIYFNRFVSGEGTDPDGPAKLDDSDFNSYTGEPLSAAGTLNKLQALGNKYCESEKTRTGGAFGEFDAEPTSPSEAAIKIYSIVDSYNDVDTDSSAERGVNTFTDGFRWNHHVYCDE